MARVASRRAKGKGNLCSAKGMRWWDHAFFELAGLSMKPCCTCGGDFGWEHLVKLILQVIRS